MGGKVLEFNGNSLWFPGVDRWPGTCPVPTVDALHNNMVTLFPLPPSKLAPKDLVNPYGGNKFINYIHYLRCRNTRNAYDLNARPLSYTQVLTLFEVEYGEGVLRAELFTEPGYELSPYNLTKLCITNKNAIRTFNALQKGFRSRFSEDRSGVRPQDMPNNHVKHFYLSEPRVLYGSLLGRGGGGFFDASTCVLAPPANTLYQEIKKSYPLADPSTFTTEISRDFFYENTNLFRFNILKNLLVSASAVSPQSSADLAGVINYSFYHHPSTIPCAKVGSSDDLLTNQFRPLRKVVSNKLRLHATAVVPIPVGVRLHILASSKDITHSWAIPSADVKIDCVPGYSSHKVAIFVDHGIFWGQCLEICGRSHWLPTTVVYFMKKDLFFLCCIHFIHFPRNDSPSSTFDKEYPSKLKPGSLDPEL